MPRIKNNKKEERTSLCAYIEDHKFIKIESAKRNIAMVDLVKEIIQSYKKLLKTDITYKEVADKVN